MARDSKSRQAAALRNKPIKAKACPFCKQGVKHIDYKDVNLLQRFMSDRSKIRGQKVNGNTVQQQRELATAIKNAREMALLPYTKRVAALGRGPRRGPGGDRPDRGERSERPADVEVTDQVETSIDETTNEGGED